ncbi:MFS transporter [Ensifer sp. YR511]|uniref:MFS transporter n=1 Tax=Ensifer sp. YR511 TaxID=1855294 RepID=UPI00088AB19A|nr:MFS transporter [Ensifer sp. YR511]SDN73051.1 Predicted arabinose efflux permease, MFS family [Ensifer sp. YR511]
MLELNQKPRRMKFLAALQHRNYRLLWIGTLISHTGDWLDQIALNWLVLEQTGSVFYLGMVNLCRGLPILFCTLIGGAMADRMERRKLMMLTQTANMVLAALLAVMVLSGNAPLVGILLVATMRGVVIAFNLPARHSLISELVPRNDLPNAVALNTMTMNLTKVIGPLLSGAIIALFGTAACFLVNAVSFLAVLWTLAAMQFPQETRVKDGPAKEETLAQSIGSGLKFVVGHRVILLLVLVAMVPTFFGQPYINLLAVFAQQVFHSGPVGLGILTASAAFGSVIGALLMANMPSLLTRGLSMLVFLLGFSLALALFAINPSERLASVLLIAAGAMYMSYNATHATLLQMTVPDNYRGRVLSTLFLNRGLVSLGTAFSATVASLMSPRVAFLIMSAAILAFALGLLLLTPAIRRLRV